MRLPVFILSAAAAISISNLAVADTKTITLPADTSTLRESTLPGYAIAQQKCGICHSADYISYQPPGMTLEQWTAEMNKMQHSYGAPISAEEIEQLGAYLAVAYGSAKVDDPAVVALTESAKAKTADAAAGTNQELDVQGILERQACLGCHAIDEKRVGPAFKAVAQRYAGQTDALAALKASIKSGGSGKWGPIPMPPQAGLNDAELAALAEFILQQ